MLISPMLFFFRGSYRARSAARRHDRSLRETADKAAHLLQPNHGKTGTSPSIDGTNERRVGRVGVVWRVCGEPSISMPITSSWADGGED